LISINHPFIATYFKRSIFYIVLSQSCIATMKLYLRRTLVLSQLYSTKYKSYLFIFYTGKVNYTMAEDAF